MITGVGTDIIEVGRIADCLDRHRRFAQRILTEPEREYCLSFSNCAERVAGRFAAKEAIAKALGTSLSWQDVEVLTGPSGEPVVSLRNKARQVAGGRRVVVSISHCRAYAVAHAIAVSD